MSTGQLAIRSDIYPGLERDIADQLKAMGPVDEIEIRINSEGGSVFTAFSILAQLNEHPAEKHGVIEGLAASAASYLCMGCDSLAIHEFAFWMIHEAQAGAIDNKHGLRQLADVLDQMDQSISSVYSARSGGRQSDFLALMRAETWLSGPELAQAGLATLIPNKGPGVPSAKARQGIANRSSDVKAILNRLAVGRPLASNTNVAAVLADYRSRAAEVMARHLEGEREENKRRIVANAGSPDRAKRFLAWS